MWTNEDEQAWQEKTKLRKKNELEVGKIHTVKMLKDMTEAIERGEELPMNIKVRYIYGEPDFACEYTPSIIGKEITLIYR